MTIGKTKSNPKDSEDRRAIRDSSGQPLEEDIFEIIPNLVEGVLPDQTIVPDSMVTRDHIEMAANSEVNRRIEAEAPEMAQGIERNRQRSQKAIW